MIDGLIAGKVYGKPATRSGASGKTFVTAFTNAITTLIQNSKH